MYLLIYLYLHGDTHFNLIVTCVLTVGMCPNWSCCCLKTVSVKVCGMYSLNLGLLNPVPRYYKIPYYFPKWCVFISSLLNISWKIYLPAGIAFRVKLISSDHSSISGLLFYSIFSSPIVCFLHLVIATIDRRNICFYPQYSPWERDREEPHKYIFVLNGWVYIYIYIATMGSNKTEF